MNEEEIEYLFPTENNEVRSINTNEIVPDHIEIIDVNESNDITSIDYNKYMEELISIYKKTTIDNSIVSVFTVDGDNCNHKIIMKDTDGNEIIESSKRFNYDKNFIDEFLILMVEDYNKENIIFNSNIEVLDDNNANFIARTKFNDSLIIMGISIELANHFKDIITRCNSIVDILDKEELNEKGIGNYLVIILTIIIIGICLIGLLFFR